MIQHLRVSTLAIGTCAVFAFTACSEGSEDDIGGGGAMMGTGGTGAGASGGGMATGGDNSGGSPSTSDAKFPFTTSAEGWAVNFERIGGNQNLGMGGAGFQSEAIFDGTEGDPAPGSLKITGPLTSGDDVTFVAYFPESALDLSGTTMTARFKLDSGLATSPDCPGGAYLYAKSGDFQPFARGPFTNLDATAGYIDLSFDPANPDDTANGPLDPTDIVEIGVAVALGGDCEGEPFVAHLDTVTY